VAVSPRALLLEPQLAHRSACLALLSAALSVVSLAAYRQQEEAIDRAQEFEREQLAATEGKTLARDRLISGDTALVQATDVGGGTSYDRWYRQNFTA